ncbi:apolipoprotein C-I-like [Lacerta agilis]|uniref:apolipoprotein C-I-like n=1 Tax=Lacerta agilis TaxID=80427 RepID=UPI001419DBD9|nr:apolipoprotein C-I-like [Lacerta agilis]
MQLAVSVAVVLMALFVVTASTEVGPTEPTLSQKFENFQRNVQTFIGNAGEKTKTVLQDIHNSEPITKARNWLSERFQQVKDKVKATFSSEGSD